MSQGCKVKIFIHETNNLIYSPYAASGARGFDDGEVYSRQ